MSALFSLALSFNLSCPLDSSEKNESASGNIVSLDGWIAIPLCFNLSKVILLCVAIKLRKIIPMGATIYQ